MTTTTKVVAWVGAILGIISIAVLALIIGATVYAGYDNREQQRHQQQAATQLKEGLEQDLQSLSKMEVKPLTGEEFRKLNSSPSPSKQ